MLLSISTMLQLLLNVASEPEATIKIYGHVECHPRVMEGHTGLMAIRAIYSHLKARVYGANSAQRKHYDADITSDSFNAFFFTLNP